MKVIHFSASDNGGAGIAAVRYHKLMQEMGINSTLYVKKKTTQNDDSIVRLETPELNNRKSLKKIIKNKAHNFFKRFLPELKSIKEAKEMYCYYNFSECNGQGMIPDLLSQIDASNVDFIFIHWLSGFINSYDIRRLHDATGAKVIFSMMDLEPITGGCHYPWTCTKYEKNCLDCPALSCAENLLSHNQLMTKAANYSCLNADIFSSALYDLEFARKSIIKFQNYHQLYYPIDENIFLSRESKNDGGEITLFANVNSVEDPRKGFNYLLVILLNLDKRLTKKVRFLCLSNKKYQGYNFKNIHFEEFAFCKNVNDLVALYQKTDIFLCASIEDSAPMMLQEALLCGVPAISFDVGVGKQFIEDGKQGYVVPRYDIKLFEEKLFCMIENSPASIQTAKEIHDHMVNICGKEAVKEKLSKILTK
ncbi:MAG: glycosyltransferase [Treponema sp.]|uniref:glycosyltransferase n=1 Tax=Treponema sp. TaxID=166 RepID=UPI0025F33440|nr:glycosyltransferase [Treponema sp.]MBQ8679066.1 glycosyltransferase [Treponema sp.]